MNSFLTAPGAQRPRAANPLSPPSIPAPASQAEAGIGSERGAAGATTNSLLLTSGTQRPRPATPLSPPSISAPAPRVGAGIGSETGKATRTKQQTAPLLRVPLLQIPSRHTLVAGVEDEDVRGMLSKMPSGTLGSDFTPGVPGFRHQSFSTSGSDNNEQPHLLWPSVLAARHPARGLICLAKQSIPTGTYLGTLMGERMTQESFLRRIQTLDAHVRLHALQTSNDAGGASVLDMTHCGNAGRYISLSHQPNSIIVYCQVTGRSDVHTTETILQGQEITVPAFQDHGRWWCRQEGQGGKPKGARCMCLRLFCPGTFSKPPLLEPNTPPPSLSRQHLSLRHLIKHPEVALITHGKRLHRLGLEVDTSGTKPAFNSLFTHHMFLHFRDGPLSSYNPCGPFPLMYGPFTDVR